MDYLFISISPLNFDLEWVFLLHQFIRQNRSEDLGNMNYLFICISSLSILIWSGCTFTSEFIRQIRYENLRNMDYHLISISPLSILILSGCTCYIRIYRSVKIWRFREYELPLHFHFSIVHCDLEWLYLLHLNLSVKKDLKIWGIWTPFLTGPFWSGVRFTCNSLI